MKPLKPKATPNKHRLSPGQINIKPHTKSLSTLLPISQYIMPGFQQKTVRYAKRQEKTKREGKHMKQTQV